MILVTNLGPEGEMSEMIALDCDAGSTAHGHHVKTSLRSKVLTFKPVKIHQYLQHCIDSLVLQISQPTLSLIKT